MRPEAVCRRLTSIALALALLTLTSCGGGGGGGSSAPPTPGSKLFFTDGGNRALISSINPTPTTSLSIDRVVQGPATGLGTFVGGILSIPSIALDAPADRLYVATQGNTFIFDNVSQANGNVPPTRTMGATINTGGGFHTVNFFQISLDTVNSILYTVDFRGEVHVFNNPTTPAGASTVVRIISPDLGATTVLTTFGLAIDVSNNMLYVGAVFSGTGSSNIIVFNDASTAGTAPTTTTPLAPNRTLTFAQAIGSFFLDTAHDRLYAAQFDGKILVFDNVSQLISGPITANRTIDPGDGVQNHIFVDTSRDKLYAVANAVFPGRGALIIVDNASTVNGNTDLPGFENAFIFNVTNIALSAVAVKP